MRTIALLAGTACVLMASAAAAQQRSEKLAYVLAAGATLAPIYAAGALHETSNRSAVPVLIASGICLGPSLGLAYAGDWGYALLSGLGKSALLGAALWRDWPAYSEGQGPEHEGHAGATMGATVVVGVWSIVDIVRAGYVVKRRNAEIEGRPPPRLVLAPYVQVGGKLSAAGLSGLF